MVKITEQRMLPVHGGQAKQLPALSDNEHIMTVKLHMSIISDIVHNDLTRVIIFTAVDADDWCSTWLAF